MNFNLRSFFILFLYILTSCSYVSSVKKIDIEDAQKVDIKQLEASQDPLILKTKKINNCQLGLKKSINAFITSHQGSYEEDKFKKLIKRLDNMGINKVSISSQFRGYTLTSPNTLYKPYFNDKNRNLVNEVKSVSPKICVSYFLESGLQIPYSDKINKSYLIKGNNGKYSFSNHGIEFAYLNYNNPIVRKLIINNFVEASMVNGVSELIIDDHWSVSNQFINAYLPKYKALGGRNNPNVQELKNFVQNDLTFLTSEVLNSVKRVNPKMHITLISLDPSFMEKEYNQPIDKLAELGINRGLQAYAFTFGDLKKVTQTVKKDQVITLYIGSDHDQRSINDLASIITNLHKRGNNHIALFGINTFNDKKYGDYRYNVLKKSLQNWN
jgi:hypothetical protein